MSSYAGFLRRPRLRLVRPPALGGTFTSHRHLHDSGIPDRGWAPSKIREIRILETRLAQLKDVLWNTDGLRYPHLYPRSGDASVTQLGRRLPDLSGRALVPERRIKLVFRDVQSATTAEPALRERLEALGGLLMSRKDPKEGFRLVSRTPCKNVTLPLSWKEQAQPLFAELMALEGIEGVFIHLFRANLRFSSVEFAKAFKEYSTVVGADYVDSCFTVNSLHPMPSPDQLANPSDMLIIRGTGRLPGAELPLLDVVSAIPGFKELQIRTNVLGVCQCQAVIHFETAEQAREAVGKIVGRYFRYSGSYLNFVGFRRART